ncbi:MAG: U32 family peptidase, partial [Oscillospiraceae bacterium]
TLQTGGLFVPGPVLTALRRQALEGLLQLREARPPPLPFQKQPLPKAVVPARPLPGAAEEEALRRKAGRPLLRARFETVGQMPAGAPGLCSQLVFPLFEALVVPEALRAQSWLEMPRLLFGAREQKARQLVQQTAGLGFKGYIAQNIAHLQLCKGLPVYGGFGLNVTNLGAGAALLSAGCGGLTLSQELTLQQMGGLAAALPPAGTDALCYGTLPLMATRACPLKNVTNCAACGKKGMLTDRKGENFAVLCSLGVRTIYNPVPLWMADRLREMPTTFATLYFTTENAAQAQQVLQAYAEPGTPPERFTRGLYYKGISV